MVNTSIIHRGTIETRDALFGLGFQPDENVLSDVRPGQSFDFGNFTLRAGCMINLSFAEIVLFTSVQSKTRSMTGVLFELPRKVKSLRQCAAWIVWNLDKYADHGVFKSARPVGWIEEGRENQQLLPWKMYVAEFKARPQCIVQRDWFRLALKSLSGHLASLPDNAGVVFSFDGSVLSIRCEGKVVALPGEGPPWAVRFSVEAGHLRRLPKRLMSERINVSIWESRISLGNYRYRGTLEDFGTVDPSRVH